MIEATKLNASFNEEILFTIYSLCAIQCFANDYIFAAYLFSIKAATCLVEATYLAYLEVKNKGE